MAQKGEQLLQRPLYVFDLPEEILATLTLKSHGDRPLPQTPSTQSSIKDEASAEVDGDDSAPVKATSCNLCGLNFASVAEQRSHVRSDLHGYNLKQKIKGVKPVSEADFDKLIGDLDESISGSESEESDEDEDEANGNKAKDSTLSALLKKQAKLTDPEYDEFASRKRQRGPGKHPLLWFSSETLPENVSLGVYRAIFSIPEQEEEIHLVESLRRKQLPPTKPPNAPSDGGVALPNRNVGPHYFLCMIGGGHFAAMVVALAPKMGKRHTGVDERSATVIVHKTFHRYTTRRKQGGSQSANDNAKGNAHSAGSSIRRYNETALINEVRELLQSWKTLIDTAELVFVRATGATNRRTLFGPYEGQVLRNNDPRNRGFPFSTRRATQKELMRAFVELTIVKQSTIDEAALAEAEKQNQRPAIATPAAKQRPPKPTKEEDEATLHTSQIMPLIKRSKVPALLNYLKTNNIPSTFSFFPVNHHTPTPLHLAASLNSAPIVTALLSKGGADPTIMNDDARTPFTLAGDRATRDAFRVARHELGESACDWEKAEVPAALSKAEADKRDVQEKAEKEAGSKAESERRKAETERLRKESEAQEAQRLGNRLGKGKSLGALPVKTGADLREEQMRGLTPEARMRLERERRARAAEERFKRMQGGG